MAKALTQIAVKANVKIPEPPNFVILESGESIPIFWLEESALKAIGQAWTQELINKANYQKRCEG